MAPYFDVRRLMRVAFWTLTLAVFQGVLYAQAPPQKQRAITERLAEPMVGRDLGNISERSVDVAAFEAHRERRREMLRTLTRSAMPRVRAQAAPGSTTGTVATPSTTTVFVVNAAYDDTDNNPGDGECWDGFYIDTLVTTKECSFRAAIEEANATAGSDSVIIKFDILTGARGATATGGFGYDATHDLWTIPVNLDPAENGPLPSIDRSNVHIDATTQLSGTGTSAFPDAYCGNPALGDTNVVKVMVDGTLALAQNGLGVLADSVSIRGLAVSNFGAEGMGIVGIGSSWLDIDCVHIGTDHFAKTAEPNGEGGVYLFGGTNSLISHSVISGNLGLGLALGDSSTVSYSLIGTDRTGMYAINNAAEGIYLGGDYSVVTRTVVSGNETGIFQTGSYSTITNVLVGTNRLASAAIPNSGVGVFINGDSSYVGGNTFPEVSIISGNGGNGVELSNQASGNVIVNAWIGLNSSGNAAIPNGGAGVRDIGGNRIGSPLIFTITDPSSSSRSSFEGSPLPVLSKANVTVVSGNAGAGISISGGSAVIQNTRIGTSPDGTYAIPNLAHGIQITGGSAHLIGGTSAGEPNLISGNNWHGIDLEAAPLVEIHGNRIGTNAAGSSAIPNTVGGISARATNATIGENLISGNTGSGISSSDPNVAILGNRIGTDATGTVAIPNWGAGVVLWSPTGAVVGSPASGNLISGNLGVGILVAQDEDQPFPVDALSKTATIANVIYANRIGTKINGTAPLPNGGDGIRIETAVPTSIGRDLEGYENRIGFNGGDGISIVGSGAAVQISRNQIFANAELGIDLAPDGVTPNDIGPPHDTDSGPNGLLNFPVISSATVVTPDTLSVTLNYQSAPSMDVVFEFFVSPTRDATGYGEGALWVAELYETTDGNGVVNFSGDVPGAAFATGLWLTATATSVLDKTTSEFSAAYRIGGDQVVLSNARVMLEGPYVGALSMGTALSGSGYLPASQPYSDPLFDGSPSEFDDLVSVESFPSGAVDWITTSLRSGTSPATEVARRVAFVHSDGWIMENDGSTNVLFGGVPLANYYLVVCHRNHICAMSSSALDFGGGVGTWDFTTGLGQAYSSGGNPMKNLGGGVFGLFAGDNSADGEVTVVDFNQWNAETTAGATGYIRSDHNLDGNSTAGDFNQWNVNTTAGAASQVPN